MSVFIFDFDDTIVDSTPKIHYEAYKTFCEMTHRTPLSLEEYYKVLFNKTYVEFIEDMHLTPAEYTLEFENWRKYTSENKPEPFLGMIPLLKRIKASNSKLVICSQSNREAIESFFKTVDIEPDLIIAGDREHPERNKPYNYPIELVKETFGVNNNQIIVIDDMKPGLIMAKNNDIKSIGVMYCGYHDMLKREIKELSTVVAESVEELEKLIYMVL